MQLNPPHSSCPPKGHREPPPPHPHNPHNLHTAPSASSFKCWWCRVDTGIGKYSVNRETSGSVPLARRFRRGGGGLLFTVARFVFSSFLSLRLFIFLICYTACPRLQRHSRCRSPSVTLSRLITITTPAGSIFFLKGFDRSANCEQQLTAAIHCSPQSCDLV